MADFFVVRKSTAEFTSENITYAENQLLVCTDIRNGVETDTGYQKLGNGVTPWVDLPYVDTGGVAGGIGGSTGSTANSVLRASGTGGATLQNSDVVIDDDGNMTGVGTVNGVKVYRALLTQSGTDAPVATVLENSLGGTVVWTHGGTGIFVATLAAAFTADKTFLLSGFSDAALLSNTETYLAPAWVSANVVQVINSDNTGTAVNDLGRGYVQILVYP